LSGSIQRIFTLKSFIKMSDINDKCSQKSDKIKAGEFLRQLNFYQILKKIAALWNKVMVKNRYVEWKTKRNK
jgi:hypothetical protein